MSLQAIQTREHSYKLHSGEAQSKLSSNKEILKSVLDLPEVLIARVLALISSPILPKTSHVNSLKACIKYLQGKIDDLKVSQTDHERCAERAVDTMADSGTKRAQVASEDFFEANDNIKLFIQGCIQF